MAVGKKTGGRKRGTPNLATARREREISKSGATPLEYMLKVMRNPKADATRRDDMAKASAPYVHPKLAAHQHTGRNNGPIEYANMTEEEIDARIAAIVAGAGEDEPEAEA